MSHYDVFNGDADGLCALHQLRLARPESGPLITGPKRHIQLLELLVGEVTAGDSITVLDISLYSNRDALLALLDAGAEIHYFDHHFAGEIPDHPNLTTYIDSASDLCTGLLVDRFLEGAFRPWAVVAAFGDNLFDSAHRAAAPLNLNAQQLAQLQELGTLLNYNGYGIDADDLHLQPEQLYRLLQPYTDPFAFINHEPAYTLLRQGYEADLAAATRLVSLLELPHCLALRLPDEPWARRVSGVIGNQLARQHPGRAHALLTQCPGGGYRVSVRAPLERREGADTLCLAYPGGGGRKAAAGINRLAEERLSEFLDQFRLQFTLHQ